MSFNTPETKIPSVVIPDNKDLFEMWKDEVLDALQIEIPKVDLKPVITAIQKIKIPEVPQSKDYTAILNEIKKNLPKETDFTPILEAIKDIKTFEIPERLIYKDHLKVTPDRVGGGGGVNTAGLATTAKQDEIVTALGESAIAATSVDASSSGDNTIVSITNTPKLYYICLSANGANSADVTAIVKIGATTKYKVSLKAGAIWARNIGAEKRYVTGSAGDDIIVNLSAAQTVHVSVEYAD